LGWLTPPDFGYPCANIGRAFGPIAQESPLE
jgi:hypothetical protein